MKLKRWRVLLPALLLGVSSLLIAHPTDRDEDKPPALGATADLSTAPRVGVGTANVIAMFDSLAP